jgi:hypothetical protein
MQKQKVPKRTFEELPKPDIYKSYRQAFAASYPTFSLSHILISDW